ncbi:MAG: helicase-related protein [Oscillospiraceae bacterium]
MGGNSKSKYWSAGTLKSRGWTEALIGELLPKGSYRYLGGKRMRTWERDAVLSAEQSERFRTVLAARRERDKTQESARRADAENAVESAVAFLRGCWPEESEQPSPGEKLAGHYHRAILKMMAGAAWADKIPVGKAMSYVGNFCTMGAAGKAENITGTVKRFITAAPWLGRNTESGLAQKLRDCYADVLIRACTYLTEDFCQKQPEANLDDFLGMKDFPAQELLSHPLSYIYSVIYVPRAIRTSLKMLMALNPKDEYPEARGMERHFIIHIGGTNTGKTYAGFQRLAEARTGVYLAPLRLLALEGQETLLDYGVKCSLTTGEEEDVFENDTHVSATAEKLDLKRRFDVAVIDECQMICDRERGYAWTRAILGVQAPEVHLCCAPHAKEILVRIIKSCGDSWEIIEHKRKTPLICMKRLTDYTDLRPGDALITFSKVGVLSLAEDLRQRGKNPAIIYGALPYSTRRRQVEGFLNGDMRYVVSTDAIGMGLNLPIRRVIFTETDKFDGVERRELKPEEVQQIAGRAGRYGMYDKGFVGATENLGMIRQALETVVPPIEYAVVGFSDLVLNVDFDLLEVLQVWNSMPTVDPYIKLDVSRYIHIISKLRENGFTLTREQELRAANIPFDETDSELFELFNRFLREYARGDRVERPSLADKAEARFTLPELEQYYRKLDLYFSFSKAFGCPVDLDELHDERERTADMINQILLHNLKNNISFCSRCGVALPLHHKGRLCNACFAKCRGPAASRPRRRK